MQYHLQTQSIYRANLERSFKAPVLSDISKVHTGYGFMPKITHASEDKDWGETGSIKRIFGAKSLAFRGGEMGTDQILKRIKNELWVLEVSNFKTWLLGFYKFTIYWRTTALSENQTLINYECTMHAKGISLVPLQWIFANWFYKRYMKKVLDNVRLLAEGDEPFRDKQDYQ